MADKKFNSLAGFFQDFEITVGGKKILLDYPLKSLIYLENEGIPLALVELEKFLNMKPMLTIAKFLYAGLPKETKQNLSYDDFCGSVTSDDMELMSEKMGVALNAYKASLPVEKKNENDTEQAEKKS